MKGRMRKEKKETVVSPLDKEKKKLQPLKPEEPPIIIKKPDEETLENAPVIQELNLKVTALAGALSGSFTEVNKKLESYDTQIKNTDEKVTALGQAISILNDEFSNFMETLPAKLAGAPVAPRPNNTPPGTSVVSSERIPLEKVAPVVAETTPPSTGDKLLQWANLLAGLAGPGKTEGGGGGLGQASSLLELVLKLQDNAEERALKRTESSIKNIASIANLLMGKKVELPIETAKAETTEHL